MSRRAKHAVRRGAGTMCNICGMNCGRGGALKRHIKGAHHVDYGDYKRCFYGEVRTIIADAWDDSVKTGGGTPVVTHVLVRRFVIDPGPRGVRKLNP